MSKRITYPPQHQTHVRLETIFSLVFFFLSTFTRTASKHEETKGKEKKIIKIKKIQKPEKTCQQRDHTFCFFVFFFYSVHTHTLKTIESATITNKKNSPWEMYVK